MFIVSLFTIAKAWKQPSCASTDEWIKKTLYIYVYTHTHHPKADQSWVLIGRTDAEAETPILWTPHVKS